MRSLQKVISTIALITLFASCQSSTDVTQTLSKPDTRKEIMNKIADDSTMSNEMMVAMMNSNNGKMMMGNHQMMMKMMKDDPVGMQSMMTDMMEACKNDTTMMSGMCKTMMGNKQMMDMMQKMKEKNMGKMNGIDTTKRADHTSHH